MLYPAAAFWSSSMTVIAPADTVLPRSSPGEPTTRPGTPSPSKSDAATVMPNHPECVGAQLVHNDDDKKSFVSPLNAGPDPPVGMTCSVPPSATPATGSYGTATRSASLAVPPTSSTGRI